VNPLYISVDLEFTSPDEFVDADIMQIGAVPEPWPDKVFGANVPLPTTVKSNEWVRENLGHLLEASWKLDHLAGLSNPPVHVGERRVPGAYLKTFMSFQQWVRQLQVAHHQYLWPEKGGAPFDPGYLDREVPAVMVTYCGGYDFAFLAKAFSTCGLGNPFHYEMLDISPLAMGILGLPWGFTQRDLEAKLEVSSNENKHDAVADARHQLELFKRLLQHEGNKSMGNPASATESTA